MSRLRMIVGLGNPGAEHLRNRHNAGFWFVDALALREQARFGIDSRLHSESAKVVIGGDALQLLKPTTFMNKSGLAVTSALRYYKIEPDELLTVRDPRAAELAPGAGEEPAAYVTRLCERPLAGDCRRVVPELQAGVVAAVVARRATERVRNAVAECVMCGADPAWAQAVRAWEAIDRTASGSLSDLTRRGDPDNWPLAGDAAEADPRLPEAELSEAGEVVIGGQRYGAAQRVSALRDLRRDSPALALHLRPALSLAQVRAVLGDTRRAGATRVAVIAREPRYPWARRSYWIADGVGPRAGLRPTDSLQLLLHAVDVTAQPGTVARVD